MYGEQWFTHTTHWPKGDGPLHVGTVEDCEECDG